jgi:hypothetical protein
MEQMLFIGSKVDEETAKNLAEFVSIVFKSGKDNGMDQSTIVSALGLVSSVVTPKNITISDCSFSSNDI